MTSDEQDRILGRGKYTPPPSPEWTPQTVTLSLAQIEAIAEAVANRVIAKIRAAAAAEGAS
jgi:hypothetical protein